VAERPRILLTGSAGQVGAELVRTLAPLGELHALARAELDLADLASVRGAVRARRPDVVVNAAAYTAVDRAESERELAFRVNAEAPEALAEEAARLGALMVHYSTDYVFDGTLRTPYTESDEPAPLGVYGESKLAGERAVAAAGGAHVVLRTSWVWDTRGHNFLRTILRLAREREELRVVDDQVGAPTRARDLAEATAAMLRSIRAAGGALDEESHGVYHLTARGSTSWYGFAREILERDPAAHEQRCRRLLPIATSEYPTAARRPAYSLLDDRRIRERWGIRLPDWRESLAEALREV
jgi:dTDP-4-dehydrorhamnose reductase